MNTEILIIEDDPVIRKELQTVLEGNKYHTSVIEDFSDVTEQVRKINPHLILLDIKLPQENGFTICSGIRSFSQAPIIFVTSCNTDMDENRWDDHNCFGKLHTCLLVLHGQKKEENRESSIALPYNFLYVEWNIFTFAEFFF